jgi:hypothetical protein
MKSLQFFKETAGFNWFNAYIGSVFCKEITLFRIVLFSWI